MGNVRQMSVLATVALLFFSGQALGADAGVIQSLQDEFRNQTATWFGPLKSIATWLLISLATIAWTWSAAQMVLKNADLQEFVVELVRLVIFVGFFLALILNADTWSAKLIEGFMWAGNQAAGASISGDVNPAAILERGFILGGKIIDASGKLTFLAFAILALVALVLYALIAAYALLVMAEMYIVTAAGVLLLGFGGSQWTDDYAKRYITYCVSVGAKLYVLFLIVGLGEQFIYNWAMGEDKSQFAVVLAIIGVLVMLVLLIKMLPDIIQGIINGTSMGSGTPSITGMAAAVGGAAVGAAVGAAGGAMAVSEASKLAGEQLSGAASSGASPGGGGSFLGVSSGGPGGGSSGGGTGPLPMPGGSGSSGGGAAPSGGGSSGGGGRMAHAAQTMKNLGGAAKQNIAGRMMGDYNASHGSMGGSMAQQMRAERLGMTQDDQSHTGGAPGQSSGGSDMSGSIGPGGSTQGGDGSGQAGGGASSPNQTDASAANSGSQESNSESGTSGSSSNAQEQPYHSPASNR